MNRIIPFPAKNTKSPCPMVPLHQAHSTLKASFALTASIPEAAKSPFRNSIKKPGRRRNDQRGCIIRSTACRRDGIYCSARRLYEQYRLRAWLLRRDLVDKRGKPTTKKRARK